MSDYQVEIRAEQARGCGRRRTSRNGVGLYLVGGGELMPCDRLPFPLVDTDGNPQKHFLGYKEINPRELFAPDKEPRADSCVLACHRCPMARLDLAGDYGVLIFVGAEHYPTPESYVEEVRKVGYSRRVGNLPKGFVFGEHRVYLAHVRGVWGTDPATNKRKQLPAVIGSFKPRLEIVIDDPANIPERAKELKDQYGDQATIVKVVAA